MQKINIQLSKMNIIFAWFIVFYLFFSIIYNIIKINIDGGEKMKFCDIDPFIRYAQFITITSSRQYTNIAPYDYRLFYCNGGSGIITVDGKTFEMKEGSLISWPPGFKYSLLPIENKSLKLIQVNFDYTKNNRNLKSSV